MAHANLQSVPAFKRGDDFERWLKALNFYFGSCAIVDSSQKKCTLLHLLGIEIQEIFETLPQIQGEEDEYKEAGERLKRYFQPQSNKLFERYKFHELVQGEAERMDSFVMRLRLQAAKSGFNPAEIDMHICDRAVGGCHSRELRQKLLGQVELTMEKVLQIASTFERCREEAEAMSPVTATTSEVNYTRKGAFSAQPKAKSELRGAEKERGPCYRCGRMGHYARRCNVASNVTCFKCGKKGHLQKMCHTKQVNAVEQKGDADECATAEVQEPGPATGQTYTMFSVKHAGGAAKPIWANVSLCGQDVQMQVDTGASCSVMSKANFDAVLSDKVALDMSVKPRLCGFDGNPLPVVGQATVEVCYGDQKCVLPLIVVQGDRNCPNLLGRDWLGCIRLNWHQLLSVSAPPVGAGDPLAPILKKYPGVFREGLGKCQTTVSLDIDPSAAPQFYKARPVPLAIRDKVDKELDRQIEEGTLVPVKSSEWAAPLVCLLKSSGSVRLCGSYDLTVNKASRVEQYPLPNVTELLTKLAGGKKFSIIDLKEAYMQVPLDEASQRYTVVNTHKGLLAATRLVYGISSAPAIFQRLMETLLAGIPHTAVFLDDVCVTGASEEEHVRNVEEVLKRLESAGLRVNPTKCQWMLDEVTYLGHKVTSQGVHTTEEKVRAVIDAPAPQDVSQLKSYLGLLTYYHRFLPNLSTEAAPLYLLLKEGQAWEWKAPQEQAFQKTKRLLVEAPVLAHYDVKAPLVVSADASPYGVGAVLSILDDLGQERPVAFASRSLAPAEKNYSQLEKEALAIIFGVKKFHQFVYGRHFQIKTDHKPHLRLLGSGKPLPDVVSPRVIRWRLTLQAYQGQLVYSPGVCQANSDALSRLPLPVEALPVTPGDTVLLLDSVTKMVTISQLRRATVRDPVLSAVFRRVVDGWPSGSDHISPELQPYFHRRNELSTEDGLLLWGGRVVIPFALRSELLHLLHQGHPGIVGMKAKARSQVWWPGIDRQIEETVNSCFPCQESRPKAAQVPERPWHYPDAPWKRVHMDHAEYEGRLILVVVDAHFKWIDAHVTSSTGAQATIECLRRSFADHGVPKVPVSDNAKGFCSEEMAAFCVANGVKQVFSPAWHPSSNGQAESAVKVVKSGLRKQASGSLQTRLCRVLFQYRTTPHSTTGRTPAELLNGRPMTTHLHRVHPDVRSRVEQRQEDQTRYNNQGSKSRSFSVGDPVFLQDVVPGKRLSAGVVSGVCGQMCDIQLPDGRMFRRHLDHVRAGVAVEAEVAQSALPRVSDVVREVARQSGAELPIPVESSDAEPSLVAKSAGSTPVTVRQPCAEPVIEADANLGSPVLRRSSHVRRQPHRLDL